MAMTDSRTPVVAEDVPESRRRSGFGQAFGNPVAVIACAATVVVAVVNGVTLWLDRDDRIEDKLDNFENRVEDKLDKLEKQVTSLEATLNATLNGEGGLVKRVIRLENYHIQAAQASATDSGVPASSDLASTASRGATATGSE